MLPVLLGLLACQPAIDSGIPFPMDPEVDSDGDGIPDLQELQEGTDPADPGSASAWHPELTERPRLLLAASELEQLQELLGREGEPWQTLQARLHSACEAEIRSAEPDLVHNVGNANTALACAVLYAAGQPETGAKAAEILRDLSTSADIGFDDVDKVDLYGGQGLLQAVRAWDLLQGAGYPEGYDAEAAGERLHELGAFLWDYYVADAWYWQAGWQNNHTSKLDASFGLLGMGANLDERAARYVNFAAGEIPRLHDGLLADDGGYAEGPSYQVYAFESVLPWLRALDLWLGDGQLTVRSSCIHSGDADCVEERYEQASPLRADARICEGFERFAELLMPSGYGPDYDDANLASGHLGLYAGLCQSGVQRWAWDWQASSCDSQGSVDVTADTLLVLDQAPAAEQPPSGALLREASGWALLRDGWDARGAYALLLAESGVARAGGGHEHPDALHVSWAARGSYLLIDGGYGSYEVHDEVNDPEAHNVILVDGAGSRGVDAGTPEAWQDGDLLLARASVSYGGVDWTRTIALADEATLVIWDRTEASDGQDHSLTLLLQGATDSLEIEAPLAQWNVDELQLQAAVLASAELAFEARQEEHAHSYTQGETDLHGTLAATATLPAAQGIRWLAVLRAAAEGEEPIVADGEIVSWPGGSAGLDGSLTVDGEALRLR